MTMPLPIRQIVCGWMIPEGTRCSLKVVGPTVTVCPALSPPLKRATRSAVSESRSTTRPLPSSPHCVPTAIVMGMDVLL